MGKLFMRVGVETDFVISVSNVSFSYGKKIVLKDVNINVAEKKLIAVVGPNGGGKTTLIKLLLGIFLPQRGEIKVLGHNPIKTRRRLGYLSQNLQLDCSFPITVEEVVYMGRLKKIGPFFCKSRNLLDEEIVEQALVEVGMIDLQKKTFVNLSGGQRQRVLIARAIATQPEILFLDEPFVGVDPIVEEALYEILQKLSKTLTILIVSHDLGFIMPIAEYAICVNSRVVIHPVVEITPELIHDIYGRKMRMVNHSSYIGFTKGCSSG